MPWWRHQKETFFALLTLCAGNSPVTGERPTTRGFDVFFDIRLNKRLYKQSWGWLSETTSCSLWRHCNGVRKKLSLLEYAFSSISLWLSVIILLYWVIIVYISINPLRTGQDGHHYQDDIFKCIFLMKMYQFRLRFRWSLLPRVQLTLLQH